MRRGRFREDLYDRLAFETLRLPPLRERKEDIPLLAAHFLNALAAEIPGIAPRSFAPEALTLMKSWPWPGNIRELKFYVERLAYRVTEPVIRPEHLPAPRQLESDAPPELDLKRTVSKALSEWGPERVREELDLVTREMGLTDGKSPLKRFI
jgi:psp operon transcriptional activator